jgi:regulator of nucleoside diphosphate kinase
MRPAPQHLISRTDADRLWRLLGDSDSDRHGETSERLEAELSRAQVVGDAVPDDVVAMGRTVRYAHEEDAEERRKEIVLVYPEAADRTAGRVSVLSPLGAALIGLKVGDRIDWPLPRGRVAKLRVLEVRK